ncbi:MAG: ATP-binding protein [Coriobacteriaceae bacterium]|jgi:DNA replication protein DnaC|nr:ATP-binding protein [Coriobacteriaceae bacterium]
MKTLVVNLFGSPGVGKTTLAHWLVAELSKMGILTEYVPEVTKALIWQGGRHLLDGSHENQAFVTEAQMGLIDDLCIPRTGGGDLRARRRWKNWGGWCNILG